MNTESDYLREVDRRIDFFVRVRQSGPESLYDFRLIGESYEGLCVTDDHPVQELAVVLCVDVALAFVWVAKARRLGFISKTARPVDYGSWRRDGVPRDFNHVAALTRVVSLGRPSVAAERRPRERRARRHASRASPGDPEPPPPARSAVALLSAGRAA